LPSAEVCFGVCCARLSRPAQVHTPASFGWACLGFARVSALQKLGLGFAAQTSEARVCCCQSRLGTTGLGSKAAGATTPTSHRGLSWRPAWSAGSSSSTRPRPRSSSDLLGLPGWLLRNGVQEHLSVFAQGFGGGASEGRLAACVYICNNKVLCLATVCYAQPYLPQVCFLVWKFFPCRSKISPCCTSNEKPQLESLMANSDTRTKTGLAAPRWRRGGDRSEGAWVVTSIWARSYTSDVI